MVKIKKGLSMAAAVLLLLAAVVLPACGRSDDNTPPPMRVSFVDVGQGDGILIECEDKVVVIDGGTADKGKDFVNYLKGRGVDSVDCYIATHPHSDHIGAVPRVLSQFFVKSFMLTAFSEMNMPTTKTYENMLIAVDEEECEVIIPEINEPYAVGNLTLTFFAPLKETDNYNNMSLVCLAQYGDVRFLFSGDAETNSEELMLEQGFDLHADVLKIGHHGSDTSTSPAFLKAVSPSFAVISCGIGNSYGHPSASTVELLEKFGVTLLRTDKFGTVVLYTDGKKVTQGVA